MKKIFYLLFLITLCFTFNIKINAEAGYCEYSLINFKESGNNFEIWDGYFEGYPDEYKNKFKVRFNIDAESKTVTTQWFYDGVDIKLENQEELKIVAFNQINYKINNYSQLYNLFMNDNKFSCPTLNANYNLNYSSADVNINVEVGDTGMMNYIKMENTDSKTPSGIITDDIEQECGVGISDEKYGLKNINILFRTYTSQKKEVCSEYPDGEINCELYENDTLYVKLKNDYILKIEKNELEKIFNGLSNECIDTLWIDSDNVFDGVYILTTEKPTGSFNTEATQDGYNENKKLNGEIYLELLGSLKQPLSILSKDALSIYLEIDGNENITLNDKTIIENDLLCSRNECISNANYYVEKGLKNIRNYCNEVYSKFESNSQESYIYDRMDECISFNSFYSTLVNEGIVNDLADYCGILSEDFVGKLAFFLNIIMIAGPILAILLGSVDFIKVITNGDADKEMKTAFKRFMIRVGSAALLFLIPALLSFILNTFSISENQDNPFCNVDDWSEKS